jgi:hypothetical protein
MANELPTPDPIIVAAVAGILRHILTLLSGFGLAIGTYSDSTLMVIASAIVGIVVAGWSLWQKIQARRVSRESSIASATLSAESGAPVVVQAKIPA